MYKYRVSIIVPIYNAVNYIEKCVHSLMNQTLSDIQFIFVDDKSNDGSLGKLEEVLLLFPDRMNDVIIYKHLQNSGVATVRNTGLSLAKGEYIGWVDADDWIENNMFEVLYTKAKDESADIVWCDYVNIYNNIENYITQDVEESGISCIMAMMDGRLLGGMCNKLIRKNIFLQFDLKFPDGLNMCEDLRVNVQLFYYSTKVIYVPYGFYKYIKYNNSSVSTLSVNSSTVNYEWISNVRAIIAFLEGKAVNISKEMLDRFKLRPKKNLLIKGRSIEAYKLWKNTFPEANHAVEYTNYPAIYKFLGWAADKEYWLLIRLWIFFKYTLLRK